MFKLFNPALLTAYPVIRSPLVAPRKTVCFPTWQFFQTRLDEGIITHVNPSTFGKDAATRLLNKGKSK